jgi:glycosyltransferase involved in cell wall biosynthesis
MNKVQKYPRVLVGFAEIAGYYSNLFDGLLSLQVDAGYINNTNFRFNYSYTKNKNPWFLNYYIQYSKTYREKPSLLKKVGYHLISLFVLIFVIVKYDVFILGCNSTLLRYYDYRLLKLLNKKIIYVSLGSDSRPPYLNGNYKDDTQDENFNLFSTLRVTKRIKARVDFFENHVDYFINYPQHAHFNSKKFINGHYIGFPTKYAEKREFNSDRNEIVILHAPTRPNAKGSEIFSKIISELKEEGILINYVELRNKTNQEVLESIKNSDIVLDEIYSDMPLAGLGSEAAMFGVPVVVGGYYSKIIKNDVDVVMIPPSIYVDPLEIKDRLRELCENKELRLRVGDELNRFINNQWNNKHVAQRFLDISYGNFNPKWYFNPQNLTYLNGWGLNIEEIKINLSIMIKQEEGWTNLHLTNKTLLDKYKKLIENA